MASFDSSSSKSYFTFDYDVFLAFVGTKRDEETMLVECLRDAEIKTFVFIPGELGSESVAHKAGRSRSVVIVLTPGVLKSVKPLNYLERTMLWCGKMKKQVLPVFFGVSQKEFLDDWMEIRRDIGEWCPSVFRAVSESGFTLYDYGNIGQIKNLVTELEKYLFLGLSNDLPGLHLRGRELFALLEWRLLRKKKVSCVIGIWGVAGIGKTTVARFIYDAIGGNFEGTSFLTNIKDVWAKENGPVSLEEQLISEIFEGETEMGIEQMKKAAHNRRVLVVLDDVNEEEQYRLLVGINKTIENSTRFGKGSLIFVTTREKELLNHRAFKLYEMRKLDTSESLKLFTMHAFKEFDPSNDFVNLSRKVAALCEGLPLVLEVISSLLHKRTKPEWKKVLNKLQGIPNGQIQQKLMISFDFLTDSEKDLFFNVACFYVNQSEHYVTQLLKGSRLPVETIMQVMIELKLVKVVKGKIHVHNLLQEIGKGFGSNKSEIKYTYDVFLSFRGEDTRKSFTTHLCVALKQAGIEVFMDEDGIERGENIASSLLQAIECSKMSIVIFSKSYVGSSWCLQELEKIMECHQTIYQEVFPIFYDVRPSEVRKQQNVFGKAWKKLIMRPSTSKAKTLTINSQRALTKAANLSGWDMQNYRTEAELIDHVIETLSMKLDDKKCLFVAHHPVGLKSRVQDIIQLLSSESSEVIIVGIWGMGGIGKTTIAKAIYNEIGRSFDGKSFLTNVREAWTQDNGQVFLQEQLLSGILKTRRMTLLNVEMGKTLIKEMLSQKRVLVVLDDVNNEEQLKALCESRQWFGQGSIIIITTRDEHLLKIL